MNWRRVTEAEVLTVLDNPDRIEESIENRRNAYKEVDGRLLKVTYAAEEGDVVYCDRKRTDVSIAMKIEYDKKVDALYIRIQEKEVVRTQEVSDGVNLDFDGEGRLIGLEVLGRPSATPQPIFSISRPRT